MSALPVKTASARKLRDNFGGRQGNGSKAVKPAVPKEPSRSTLKNAPAKEFRLTLRQLYTWHLDPRFKDLFDCEHWWEGRQTDDRAANRRVEAFPADLKGEAVVESVAALYEVSRRHPAVFAAQINPELLDALPQFHPMIILHIFGLKSWPKLSAPEQESWRFVAGSMKGVDARPDSERCRSVEDEAAGNIHRIRFKRAFTDKKYQKMRWEKVSRLVEEDMRKSPPLRKEIEAEIKREALSAYRQGDLLIAVAPDMAEADAKRLMAQTWSQHRKERKIFKHRARSEQWLPLIARFENEVTANSSAYPPSLTHYRRIFVGIPFPNFFPSPAGKSPQLKADA